MQIENVWSGLIAIILGVFFGIAFYYVFSDIIGIVETPLKLFIAIIVGIVMFRMLIFIPIKAVTQDDTGRSS